MGIYGEVVIGPEGEVSIFRNSVLGAVRECEEFLVSKPSRSLAIVKQLAADDEFLIGVMREGMHCPSFLANHGLAGYEGYQNIPAMFNNIGNGKRAGLLLPRINLFLEHYGKILGRVSSSTEVVVSVDEMSYLCSTKMTPLQRIAYCGMSSPIKTTVVLVGTIALVAGLGYLLIASSRNHQSHSSQTLG